MLQNWALPILCLKSLAVMLISVLWSTKSGRGHDNKVQWNSTIQVISIPVIDSNKVLEAFYSTDEDGFFVTVFEKVGTINNKGQFTGTNYLRSRQGDIIAEKFRNNQLIGSAIKDNLSSPGGRQEPPNPCYACINHNYQQIKSKCEVDMVCDIACTLTPCFAVWSASAIAACTSGGGTGNPCNPFTID